MEELKAAKVEYTGVKDICRGKDNNSVNYVPARSNRKLHLIKSYINSKSIFVKPRVKLLYGNKYTRKQPLLMLYGHFGDDNDNA